MPRILVVEDELHMQLGIKDNLEFEGYDVDAAADGEEGLMKISSEHYDLIILDLMLPKRSGLDVCKTAREQGIKTPIIMLTAKGEEVDKVVGLELGADDYVTKPFSLRELLARIKAVLRRPPEIDVGADQVITVGKLTVEFATYTATREEQPVAMTHREIEILKYLWQHKNEVVSREKILQDVWGYEALPTTRTVDNFMLKLRQKIENDPAHPRHIVTVHGIGYKMLH